MMTNNDDTIFPTARDIVYEKNKDKTALRSKVMQLRLEIKQKGFKKGGHNKFQNYDHYTIDDILEVVYPLLCKYHLSTWYNFNVKTRVATLEITDLDTGYTDFVSIEDPLIKWENSNKVLQGIGKSQTYLRKYLYIQFLDISESDPDSSFGETVTQTNDTHTKHVQNDETINSPSNNKMQVLNKQTSTNKIPHAIQIIIAELEEKNIKPSRKTIREHTKKQLQSGVIDQKEFNALQNMILSTPEELLT